MSSHAEYRKKGGNGLAYNMPKPVPSPARLGAVADDVPPIVATELLRRGHRHLSPAGRWLDSFQLDLQGRTSLRGSRCHVQPGDRGISAPFHDRPGVTFEREGSLLRGLRHHRYGDRSRCRRCRSGQEAPSRCRHESDVGRHRRSRSPSFCCRW